MGRAEENSSARLGRPKKGKRGKASGPQEGAGLARWGEKACGPKIKKGGKKWILHFSFSFFQIDFQKHFQIGFEFI